MRLLVISPVFPPMRAGEAEYAYHLCSRLAARGHAVDILTTQEKNIVWARPPGLTLHPVAKDWHWRDLVKVLRAIRRLEPDAILLLYLGWPFDQHPMATYLPLLSKRFYPKARFVTLFFNRIGAAMHQNSPKTRAVRKAFSLWAGPLDSCYEFGTLLTQSDAIFVLAEKHKAFLEPVHPPMAAKTKVLPSLPCLNFYPGGKERGYQAGRTALGLSESDFVVVFFGLLYPGKGVESLLAAFRDFARQLDSARLVVIGGALDASAKAEDGPGYAKRLEALAAELGISDRVRWTGAYSWDSETASKYLYAADVCALPFDVGIALNNSTLAAAAAHGLPIVSTLPEKLESAFLLEENCILVPAGDTAALAGALQRVASDGALRHKLSGGAFELARAHFSWDTALDAFTAALTPEMR